MGPVAVRSTIGKFISQKENFRRNSVAAANCGRADHACVDSDSVSVSVTPAPAVTAYECEYEYLAELPTATDRPTATEPHDSASQPRLGLAWNQGRRIVELRVLADGLVCEDCTHTLSLANTIEETKLGLGSLLYILCDCGVINSVPTGKTHRREGSTRGVPIFDVNSKVATGKFILKE